MPCTDVTVAFVNGADVEAFQISAVPNCVLTRFTSVHVRPAPVIASVCLDDVAVGPADDANSTSISFGSFVLKAGVVTVFTPSAGIVVSTVSDATAGDPDETSSATEVPPDTEVPPAGVCPITAPAGTVALDAVVTAPTTRPAFVI